MREKRSRPSGTVVFYISSTQTLALPERFSHNTQWFDGSSVCPGQRVPRRHNVNMVATRRVAPTLPGQLMQIMVA